MKLLVEYVSKYCWLHLLGTGLLVVPFSFFLAVGTIAENYTSTFFAAPEFMYLIVVWVAGSLLFLTVKTRPIGVVITYLCVVPGYHIAYFLAL